MTPDSSQEAAIGGGLYVRVERETVRLRHGDKTVTLGAVAFNALMLMSAAMRLAVIQPL